MLPLNSIIHKVKLKQPACLTLADRFHITSAGKTLNDFECTFPSGTIGVPMLAPWDTWKTCINVLIQSILKLYTNGILVYDMSKFHMSLTRYFNINLGVVISRSAKWPKF